MPLEQTKLFSGGLDTDEPWQGRWERGVLVECVGTPPDGEREEEQEGRFMG